MVCKITGGWRSRLDEERAAVEAAERHLAAWTGCAPADVQGDLSKLSRREVGVTEDC